MGQRWTRFRRRYFAWLLLLVALVIIGVLLIRDVDFSPVLRDARANAGIIAVFIALASLLVVSLTSWKNWSATRKEATLDAWNRWSDATRDDRILLSQRLGMKALTSDQGKALVDRNLVLTDKHGAEVSMDDRRELLLAATRMLNGLERLAVGVEAGVYRQRVLVDVGGTIIKRSYERLESYVDQRRTASEQDLRQEKAFVALERLAKHISFNEVDAARLKSLRRQQ